MSDTWLLLVPVDPAWCPTPEVAERAADVLRAFLPEAEEVNVEITDTLQFVHPFANWQGVACPACGADVEDWWDGALEAAGGDGFTDLAATTPCCGLHTSLNDLTFAGPSTFGRLVIEAQNPKVEALTAEQTRHLTAVLGAPVRTIWRRLDDLDELGA